SKVAESDPLKALQYVNDFESSNAQQRVIATATQKWQETDPAGAMHWLHNQPAEAGVEEIIQATAKSWVLNQPQAASQWIHEMKSGLHRDHAVAGMVHALISSSNPSKDF